VLPTDDAIRTMRPVDVRIEGVAAVGEFFATETLGGHIDRIALVPTRASGQPGFARYADEHDSGQHDAYGVVVFALRGDKIAGFPQDTDLFEQLSALLLTPRSAILGPTHQRSQQCRRDWTSTREWMRPSRNSSS
jgi:hypothetical protein